MVKRVTTIILIIISVIAAYSSVILMKKDVFPGNTTINDKSFSYANTEQVVNELKKSTEYKEIKVLNNEEKITTIDTKEYLDVEYNKEELDSFLDNISIIERLLFFLYDFDYHIEPQINIIDNKFAELVEIIDSGEEPQNAYVRYDNKTEMFVIEPETQGNQVDKDTASKLIKEAAIKGKNSVNISETYVKAGVLSQDESLNKYLEKLNNDFSFVIKYTIGIGDNKSVIELKGKELIDLYERDENGVPYTSGESYEVNKKNVEKFIKNIKISSEDFITAQAGNENIEIPQSNEGMSQDNKKTLDKEVEWLINKLKEQKDASFGM